MVLTSLSQITFPASFYAQPTALRKQIRFTDIIENQKKIFHAKEDIYTHQ